MPPVAEIAVRGYLVSNASPPSPRSHPNPAEPLVYLEDVDRQIYEAVQAGARVLLSRIDSWGGDAACAWRLYAKLRRFADHGGVLVCHVVEAASTAPALALAGDLVVVDPRGRLILHSASADTPGTRDEINEWMARTLAERGLAPLERVRTFLVADGPDGDGAVLVDAETARVELGWADLVAPVELARALAELVAREGAIPATLNTPRRRALAERRAAHAPPEVARC